MEDDQNFSFYEYKDGADGATGLVKAQPPRLALRTRSAYQRVRLSNPTPAYGSRAWRLPFPTTGPAWIGMMEVGQT